MMVDMSDRGVEEEEEDDKMSNWQLRLGKKKEVGEWRIYGRWMMGVGGVCRK